MRNRVFVMLLLGASIGTTACKKADKDPAVGSGAVVGSGSGSAVAVAGSGSGSAGFDSGSGSGSGSAAPAVAGTGTCWTKDSAQTLVSFTSTDKVATFCVKDETDPPKGRCQTVDLATGAMADGPAPVIKTDDKKAPAPKSPSGYEAKQSTASVQLCMADKCVKAELPKLPAAEQGGEAVEYSIAFSDDGKHAIATGAGLKEGMLLDAATGKLLKKLAPKDSEGSGEGCLESGSFLGNDAVYLMQSVCAGPGGSGYVFTLDGKQTLTTKVNVYYATPLHLDGDLWAFSDLGGGNVDLVDVKASSLKTIEVPRSDDCQTCVSMDGPNMIAEPLVKAGDKLVTISSEGVTILDPKAGTVVKTHRYTTCADVAKPAP